MAQGNKPLLILVNTAGCRQPTLQLSNYIADFRIMVSRQNSTMPLSSSQLQLLEKLLQETTVRLRQEIAAGMQLPNHMTEIDDAPVAQLENALDIAAVERDMRELKDTLAALDRLKRSEYGNCVICGDAIPFARLQAQPAATRCINCQTAAERGAGAPPSL